MDNDIGRFGCLFGMSIFNLLVIVVCYCSLAYKVEHIEPVVVTEYLVATPGNAETATECDAEVSIEVNEVELHQAVWYPPTEVSRAQICQIRIANGTVDQTDAETIKGSYIGCMELTAYIATGNPCADGVYPQTGYTAASNNPNLWHKWIHIEGYGDYYIHDRGGMPSNVIDIYVGSYGEAIQFGRRIAEVYIKE